jgi:anti-anti-sigma regulatory factor
MHIIAVGESGAVPVTVLHIKGSINADTYGQLQEQARQAIERGTHCIVLDLADVPYMSSAGLRVINYLFHAMRTGAAEDSDAAIRDGMKAGTYRSPHVKLARPTPRVSEVLNLAGINLFIEIHDDLQAAIESFKA